MPAVAADVRHAGVVGVLRRVHTDLRSRAPSALAPSREASAVRPERTRLLPPGGQGCTQIAAKGATLTQRPQQPSDGAPRAEGGPTAEQWGGDDGAAFAPAARAGAHVCTCARFASTCHPPGPAAVRGCPGQTCSHACVLHNFGVLGICSLSLSLCNAVFVTICFLISLGFGTYLRFDLLLGSAKGCPSSACISLCGCQV